MKLCECGCGKPTLPSARTSARDGVVKGQPLRFVLGHNGRNPRPARRHIASDAAGFVPATVEDAEFADGPGFAEWMAAHGLMTDTREFRAWRNGERRPSFYTVDRILTRAGMHAIDVPDHLWVKRIRTRDLHSQAA